MTYLYRGRHRRPTHTTRRAVTVVAGGAVAFGGPGVLELAAAPAAVAASPTETLRGIAHCESSNNPRASGPVTKAGGHFGLFQFDLPTWRSVGGTGNPRDASVEEQYRRAAMLLARRGTQPWLASQSCWTRRGVVPLRAGAAPAPTAPAARPDTARPAPRTETRTAARTVTVRRGDTLNKIAARNGTTWRALWAKNRGTVRNPALIFPGQRLNL